MASELKELKRQARQLQNTFDGVRRFIDRFKKEKHYLHIDTRLEMLEAAMAKFYAIRSKIEEVSEGIDEKGVAESKESSEERTARLEILAERRCKESAEVIAETEDVYCDLRSSLRSLKNESTPGTAPAVQTPVASLPAVNPTSTVKLPELRLPSFSGRLREWVTFRDMFQSLIHRNRQLSDMDKFSYLRSSLVGEALQEVTALEMTSANYAIAWDLLQKRYENRKLIVKAHLDALFAVEPMKRESYEALNHLLSEYDRNLQMMEKIGEHTANWSTILVHMVCSRLDATTLRYWESHHCSKEVPKYEELIEFLRNQCSVLQSIAPEKPSTNTEFRKPKTTVSHASMQSSNRCPFCGESQHSAFRCLRFLKMKVPERYEKVKKCGLCLNCFSSSHLVRFCTKGVCRHCQRRHHTLLHSGATEGGAAATSSQIGSSVPQEQTRTQRANNQQTQPHAQNHATPSQGPGPNTSSFPIASTHSHPQPTTDRTPSHNTNSLPVSINTPSRPVLLSTALVRITDQFGNMQLARALLDSCSEYCFITRSLCQKLQLVGLPDHLSIVGIGGTSTKSSRTVSATVMPRSLKISSYAEHIQLHVLPKLTSDLPTEYVNVQHLAIPEHLMLADPTFFEPGSIDMIIGAEYYYDLLAEGKIKLCDGGPTLHETVFGWVVSGRVPGSSTVAQRTHSHPITSPDLNDLLTKFWELESCHSGGTLSVEESACEEIFERIIIRNEVGRFVVTLPKKKAVIQVLDGSKATALKRFCGLECRLATNSALKEAYFTFIEEYKSMGHMEEVPEGEEPVYYLPHHTIMKHGHKTPGRVLRFLPHDDRNLLK
ncbi:uncharacterized protein LOC134206659 [Armigeres subalbatus]|uniref:uncharacterized protein LOC134206659 n=1 Tax=Armigeres subalbatus TaxID=124917 RepID=UPI002ED317EE